MQNTNRPKQENTKDCGVMCNFKGGYMKYLWLCCCREATQWVAPTNSCLINANRLGFGAVPRKVTPLSTPGSYPSSPKPFLMLGTYQVRLGCGLRSTTGPSSGLLDMGVGESSPALTKPLLGACSRMGVCLKGGGFL